ncbi:MULTISPECIES: TetR/AcrR family transcriptional regulator [unclassified Sedimentibacter]|uniref:TetR/AcrR family transcriptional regulator n=1 Tax=unclassified Sedimentibacter TaxID=2649220 RepID=UPI0027E13CA1|nr:TetR/AcrR family transcriptional regulator [Sedimentibacter sp. MB35-C1]WMJ77435.1 TetR/AcrR family transcriptional regulator [Sedimentibacter sp. MB35-C1]
MNKRTKQANETKKRIIDCARKLFAEKGYNSVTVDEIIKEANSSKGGFYTHFKTKESLISGMIPFADEAYEKFAQTDRKCKDTMEKIFSLINFVFYFMENEVGLEFLSVMYSSQIKDLNTERFIISPEREYYKQLRVLIEEAKIKKEITDELETEEIMSFLTTCIRGVLYDWCLKKGMFQLSSYGMRLVNMVLNQMKP